jgi:hypothetical protein
MDFDRDILLQKHNNCHKTLLSISASFIAYPIYAVYKYSEVISYLNNTSTSILTILTLVILATYSAAITVLIYKCDEYEIIIKNKCASCLTPNGPPAASP